MKKLLYRTFINIKKIAHYVINFLFYSIVPARVICNICHWKGKSFAGDKWHPHTICPYCESQVRHRLLWAVLTDDNSQQKNILTDKKILHVAPELFFRKKIKRLTPQYYTADKLEGDFRYSRLDYITDISNMDMIHSDSFDIVIALDVLEHVKNDMAALSEIKRILKQNACFIVTVPQSDLYENTLEDLEINDPKEREARFGHQNHYRIYGNDFFFKLKEYFTNILVFEANYFPEEFVRKFVLFPPHLSSDPLASNNRKIYLAYK